MTYEAVETSTALGRPVELYFFERWGVCWPYTSADSIQTHAGHIYHPATISRGAFERNDDSSSSQVKVRLDRGLKVAGQFIDGSTPRPVNLTIFRKHRTDNDFIVMFKGIVANADLVGEEVSLACASPLGSDEKAVPRHLIMRTCPHVLYGPRCSLDFRDWDAAGTIVSITSNVVKVSGLANLGADYYTAGVIGHDATGKRAFVQDHAISGANQDFTLLQPPIGWSGSDAVTVLAGCDRKHTTCRDKFNNIPNFGGFPLHPERNPILDLQGN